MAAPMTRAVSVCFSQYFVILLGFLQLTTQDAPDTLRLVNILFRHGDRSPTKTFPTDKNTEKTWPQGFGQLSQRGMQQHYELGQFFRERYNGYLNKSYVRTEIYVRSTDVDRTLMSAYSNLAGLYPPSGGQKWNDNITWQPIPVHTRPNTEDPLLVEDVACPKYDKLYDDYLRGSEVKAEEKQNALLITDEDSYCPKWNKLFLDTLNSKEVTNEEQENKAFYKFVADKSGYKNESISVIWKVYDPLFCEWVSNRTLPDWVNTRNLAWGNQTVFKKLKWLENYSFQLLFKTPDMNRLRGGLLVKAIIQNMRNKINSTKYPSAKNSVPKVFMYSAHDTTVAAYLAALGIYDGIAPPYAAAVMTELHQINGKWVVQLWYRNISRDPGANTTGDNLHMLKLNGCDSSCSLNVFDDLTKAVQPEDWQKECAVDNGGGNLPLEKKWIIVIASVGGCALLLIIVITGVCCWRRRRGNQMAYSRDWSGINT